MTALDPVSCRSFGPLKCPLPAHHALTRVAIDYRPLGPHGGVNLVPKPRLLDNLNPMSVQTLPQTRSREIVTYNPATGAELGRVPLSSPEDVRQAVRRAREAQPAWASLTFRQRAKIILKARALLLKEREEVAELVSRETG